MGVIDVTNGSVDSVFDGGVKANRSSKVCRGQFNLVKPTINFVS